MKMVLDVMKRERDGDEVDLRPQYESANRLEALVKGAVRYLAVEIERL